LNDETRAVARHRHWPIYHRCFTGFDHTWFSADSRSISTKGGEVLPSFATPLRKIEHATVSLDAAKISRPSPSQEIDKLGQGYMNQLARHTDTKGESWVWKWQWKYITSANPSAVDEMLDGELLTPYIR
jgi:hypothetical protein